MSEVPPSARELRQGPKASLRQLLDYLRPHARVLAVVALVSLVGAGLTLAQPALVRAVLDRIGRDETITGLVVGLVVLTLVDALVGAGIQYLLLRTALRVVLDARRGLVAHLLRLPIPAFDLVRTGDLISRVGADTTLLQTAVTGGFVQAASSLVVAVGAIVAMALVDVTLLVVTLAVVGVSSVVTILTARRVRELTRVTQVRVGEMTAGVERALSGVRTIRANRAEAAETTRIDRDATAAYDAGLQAARLQALLSPVSSVAAQTAFLGVLGVGGARVAAGELAVADLVAFVLYLFLLVRPLAQVVTAWLQIQAGLAAVHRIEEVTATPIETADDPVGAPPFVDGEPRLAVRGLSFGYADGPPVLDDVSFEVAAGARVALVGPSGAGKSTLLALVERFRDPTSGTIELDGVDLRAMPRELLRSRVGYVEQESPVLAGTLRDNLLLGDPTADDERLLAVLDSVRLGELVTRTDAGLDVQVGERGLKLSGGERQRLAIGRVLLAAPDVLLLDEPTSNLDARNEEALKRAIDEVAVERTLLVVAHRLSTVADSDLIVVLEHGRVRATGTHDELVATDDLYRELATTQLLVPSHDDVSGELERLAARRDEAMAAYRGAVEARRVAVTGPGDGDDYLTAVERLGIGELTTPDLITLGRTLRTPIRPADSHFQQIVTRRRKKQLGVVPEKHLGTGKRNDAVFADVLGLLVPRIHFQGALRDVPADLREGVVVKPVDASDSRGAYYVFARNHMHAIQDGRRLDGWDALLADVADVLGPEAAATPRWVVQELVREGDGAPARDLKFYTNYGHISMILEVSRFPEPEYAFFDGRTFDEFDSRAFPTFDDPTRTITDRGGVGQDDLDLVRCVSLALPIPFMRIDFLHTPAGLVFVEFCSAPGASHTFAREQDRLFGTNYLEAEIRLVNDLLDGKRFDEHAEFLRRIGRA